MPFPPSSDDDDRRPAALPHSAWQPKPASRFRRRPRDPQQDQPREQREPRMTRDPQASSPPPQQPASPLSATRAGPQPPRPAPTASAPTIRRDAPPPPPPRPPARRQGNSRPPRPPRRLFGRLLRWAAVLFIWGVASVGVLVAWYAHDLPSLADVSSATRRPSLLIQGSDGSIIANYGDLYGEVIDVSELPPWVPGAVISIEDRRFYDHHGVDPLGLLRAVVVNVQKGRMAQGGSTLTQQVVKNVFLSQERTLKRKVQELLLSLWLERTFTKQQILTLYLNRVYLGAGTYGVEAAAQRYFGVSARQVTPFQAAVLAGLLKAPSRYSPASNPDLATSRASVVLNAMVENGVLSQQQAQQALATAPTALANASKARPGRYFSDWVMEQVDDLAGSVSQDLIIKTTLDPTIQAAAEQALAKTLDSKGPAANAGEGAMVVLTPDGAVRAMVGGRSYANSQYNRAVQALRQPGSSFKPFVYLAGLESGLLPDDVVEDAPITISGWSPENFDHRYHGQVTLRDAVANSLNTVAVRVSQRAGLQQVIGVAHRLGITADLQPTPSLALGTQETAVLPLVGAYAAFANGGYAAPPFGISEITTRDGQILYLHQQGEQKQVIRPQDVGNMNQLLSGVIQSGTGKRAAIGRPAAGKTGTSADYRDAWFIGYTADYVAGVWIGNDNNTPMKRVTGGSLPADIWREVMLAAQKGKPMRDLPVGETDDLIGRLLRSVLGEDSPRPSNTPYTNPLSGSEEPQELAPQQPPPEAKRPPPLLNGKVQPNGSLSHQQVIDLFDKN